MNLFDIVFLGLLIIFFLLSYMRGMVQEIFTLLGLVGGFLVANWFAGTIAQYLSPLIPDAQIAGLIAYGLIILLGYYVAVFLGGVSDFYRNEAESGLHRLIGGVIGILKGLILSLALYWVVLNYIPAFHPDLKRSWMGDFMATLIRGLQNMGVF